MSIFYSKNDITKSMSIASIWNIMSILIYQFHVNFAFQEFVSENVTSITCRYDILKMILNFTLKVRVHFLFEKWYLKKNVNSKSFSYLKYDVNINISISCQFFISKNCIGKRYINNMSLWYFKYDVKFYTLFSHVFNLRKITECQIHVICIYKNWCQFLYSK